MPSTKSPHAYCEQHVIQACFNQTFPGFCEIRDLFEYELKNWTEVPLTFMAIVLSALIIIISIYGTIEGTFRWCLLNIAVLHLLWPIFNKILMDFILTNVFHDLFPKPIGLVTLMDLCLCNFSFFFLNFDVFSYCESRSCHVDCRISTVGTKPIPSDQRESQVLPIFLRNQTPSDSFYSFLWCYCFYDLFYSLCDFKFAHDFLC